MATLKKAAHAGLRLHAWMNQPMDLPATVVCEGCGDLARVPRQSIEEDARAGQLRGFDQAWHAGFEFTVECPNCGRQKQRLMIADATRNGDAGQLTRRRMPTSLRCSLPWAANGELGRASTRWLHWFGQRVSIEGRRGRGNF
jgi:hypothetical protein